MIPIFADPRPSAEPIATIAPRAHPSIAFETQSNRLETHHRVRLRKRRGDLIWTVIWTAYCQMMHFSDSCGSLKQRHTIQISGWVFLDTVEVIGSIPVAPIRHSFDFKYLHYPTIPSRWVLFPNKITKICGWFPARVMHREYGRARLQRSEGSETVCFSSAIQSILETWQRLKMRVTFALWRRGSVM
jgi:hypothetical protein